MYRRFPLLILVISGLFLLASGCTNLDKVDLSCEIPLSPSDEVGFWHRLADRSDTERYDNQSGDETRVFSPYRYQGNLELRESFYLRGTLYTLYFTPGSRPYIQDQYHNYLPVQTDETGSDYNWNDYIQCSFDNIGKGLRADKAYTMRFIDPVMQKPWVVTCSYSVNIQIMKGTYTVEGTTYEYPYASMGWSVSAAVALRHSQVGSVQLPDKLTVRAAFGDSNLDGQINESDTVSLASSGKGISFGGLSGVYPLNRMVAAGKEYGYMITARANPQTQQDAETLYTIVIKRQPLQ